MKAGYRTTEFWITLLSVLGAIVMASRELLSAPDAAIAASIAAGLYAVSRGLAKLNT
jgi:hypothetical protein